MRLLETHFPYEGHYLKQIWRGSDVAVFERSLSPEHPAHEFELILIRIKPEGKTPTGSIVPEREAYPSSSEWGRYAWSFPLRYRQWVLDLAKKLLAITNGRAAFVREQSHQLWLSESPKKLSAVST